MKITKTPQEITENLKVRAWGDTFRVKTGSAPVNLKTAGISYATGGLIYIIPPGSFIWTIENETELEIQGPIPISDSGSTVDQGPKAVQAEFPVVDKWPYKQLPGSGTPQGSLYGWPTSTDQHLVTDFLLYFGVDAADAQELADNGFEDTEISFYLRDKREGYSRFEQTDFFRLADMDDTVILDSLITSYPFEFRSTYNDQNKTIKITDNHSVGNTYGSVYGIVLRNAFVG